MREVYQQVQSKIADVDFQLLWPNFLPFPFALYDSELVYLEDREIPWDDRFLANTAIAFEGGCLAIWNVEMGGNEDLNQLAVNLIHEMFHCFQSEQGETRYPSELDLVAYPIENEVFQSKYAENRLLVDFVRTGNNASIQEFIYLRRQREQLIGNHFYNELKVETIEGAAEFVAMQALHQLSSEQYEHRLEEYLSYVTQISADFFNVRRMAYYTGTLLLLALPNSYDTDLTLADSLYKMLAREIEAKPYNYEENSVVEKQMKSELHQKKEIISQFSHFESLEGKLSGFDPMNMFRLDDWLYCKHFVTVEGDFFEGPILLDMISGSMNQVRRYSKS